MCPVKLTKHCQKVTAVLQKRRLTLRLLFIFSFASLLLLTGCSSSATSADSLATKYKEPSATNINQSKLVVGRSWQLVELQGEPISMLPNQDQSMYFILQAESSLMNGYTGCNTMFGTYSLGSGQRIDFNQIASTKRACSDQKIKEFEYLQVFSSADSYRVRNGVLELNAGKRARIAVFKPIEF
jgi:heat shock protein HslJ